MKFIIRSLFCFALGLASLSIFAGEMPFNQKTFDELRNAGKPVVVHFHATWCAVCKKQAEVVNTLTQDKPYKDVNVLLADVDTEKELMKSMNVAFRSTFVAFKGTAEVGRSAGETDTQNIAALLQKTL
jgi:thioredoxin 1